jgi:16S rRNA C1402 (ribose-2'-O) methylase RsmI
MGSKVDTTIGNLVDSPLDKVVLIDSDTVVCEDDISKEVLVEANDSEFKLLKNDVVPTKGLLEAIDVS